MRVYRTDLGVTQTYYGLFNASTNPGGRDVAGWYDTEKNVGLVPIQPASVTAVSGTATANAMGAITYSGCSAIILNGVFTPNFRNYRIVSNHSSSNDTRLWARLSSAGTQQAAGYFFTQNVTTTASTQSAV
jgi:hypothetical protein